MPEKIRPFLMFEGRAEEAMNFYVSLFPGSSVTNIVRYGPGQPGKEGSVTRADLTLAGQSVICIDSPAKHDFGFTPSFSFFVDCLSEEELDTLVTALVKDGSFLMPPDNYGFSRKFAWIKDRFGVSWQINLT